jgi:hypothetical protein
MPPTARKSAIEWSLASGSSKSEHEGIVAPADVAGCRGDQLAGVGYRPLPKDHSDPPATWTRTERAGVLGLDMDDGPGRKAKLLGEVRERPNRTHC